MGNKVLEGITEWTDDRYLYTIIIFINIFANSLVKDNNWMDWTNKQTNEQTVFTANQQWSLGLK